MNREKVCIKVIGLGGIGGWLLTPLCRYLNYSAGFDRVEVTLVDGDSFESRNVFRQCSLKDFLKGQMFDEPKKVNVYKEMIKEEFDRISVKVVDEFVTDKNVKRVIKEGEIVFLCVDNHYTRKIVASRCEQLKNVVLISGGNDDYDGNCYVYVRRNSQDITIPMSVIHPEIKEAKPESFLYSGGERESCCSCETIKKDNQHIFTNMGVAWMMLCSFLNVLEDSFIGESFLDIRKITVRSVERRVGGKNGSNDTTKSTAKSTRESR